MLYYRARIRCARRRHRFSGRQRVAGGLPEPVNRVLASYRGTMGLFVRIGISWPVRAWRTQPSDPPRRSVGIPQQLVAGACVVLEGSLCEAGDGV